MTWKQTHRESYTTGRTPEYTAWCNMIQRCENPRGRDYVRYGGRGIRVCERWRNSYESFLADMGRKPTPSHSVERDDVNGDYCAANCRWADRVEQARNKRNNRMIEACGESLCLEAWADRSGIGASLIRQRIDRLGWDTERAVTVPAGPRRFAHNGKLLTLDELATETGIPKSCLRRRIAESVSVDEAIGTYENNSRGKRLRVA